MICLKLDALNLIFRAGTKLLCWAASALLAWPEHAGRAGSCRDTKSARKVLCFQCPVDRQRQCWAPWSPMTLLHNLQPSLACLCSIRMRMDVMLCPRPEQAAASCLLLGATVTPAARQAPTAGTVVSQSVIVCLLSKGEAEVNIEKDFGFR